MEWRACLPSEGPLNIPVITGRGRYDVGTVPTRVRRTMNRSLTAVHCSETVTNPQYRGSQPSQPSTLTLVLLNARSVSNKPQLIHDLILEEDADLACITETWLGGEGGPPLALICLPGYAIQHQGRLEGRGGGVAIVYKSILEVTRCFSVVKPGLEALHVAIGARDGIGILLGYRAPRDPATSLPELADFVSAALLGSPRLLALGDFNVHAEAEVTGPAFEFLETMASLNMSQHVNGPTHVGGHTLDLVFSTNWSECDLMVTDLVSVPLSWSDHHLIKCNLSVALPPHREQGPISMVRPRRLLDPVGFQDAMRGVTADLADAPVEALVDTWSIAATRAIDMIAPKHPLQRRARPVPWFNQVLRTMKRMRRRLVHRWRKNPTDYNWIAVRVATNLYLTKVKAACRSFFANQISEVSNQQAELFRMVHDISGTGSGDRPCDELVYES
uniref:Endophilin-A1 isoform X1 n=1 Tax=Pogona vitticeps TaxID=103695 RepID=A0ABM5FRX5_9SAUR